jgi:hypothetical protein
MRDKVAKLRQLLSEAVAEKVSSPAVDPFAIQQTERARIEREISRLAGWYGWDAEVIRQLDMEGAEGLFSLSLAGCQALLARLQRLEDCYHNGLGPPDSGPAV